MHSTLWLLFKGQELLVKTDDLAFPLLPHHSLAHLLEAQAHHVTVYQQQPVSVLQLDDNSVAPEGYHFQHLRSLLTCVNSEQFSLAGTASQILEWVKSHRFCSRCGTATVPLPNGERA